ncbi:MAG: FAD/NAD(P)-binding protein [Oryzomonas sp.]|uniref:FAD/NAD(P)-binding protein n=1 Tax=Oryzomonas sp. TaxID=2855186 RepID=UPI0028505648|nr:FAD/NAD(P)-binding protein [Oryzomonas sp.]MDR3579828.1 FAD/NAD(P)-binding protein [Oryzomonas sp.]
MRNSRDMTIVPLPATIIGRKALSADTTLYRLALESSEEDGFDFNPGQFVQLSVPSGGEVPISLAGPPRHQNSFELCIRRVGHVTDMLYQLLPPNRVGIRGPFGNGFPFSEWAGRNILLIAGGLGIAPLRSLLYALLMQRGEFGEITFMYGAREPSAILFKEELAELSGRKDMHLFVTVDFTKEESPGGLTCNTGLLPTLLRGVNFSTTDTVAAVCGPPALYKCLLEELQDLGIPAAHIYLSLERRMKCGVGLCCHCAVGDLFCCSDGPVFRYSQLKGISGAI